MDSGQTWVMGGISGQLGGSCLETNVLLSSLAFPVPERDVCAGDELKPATSPSRFSVMLSEKHGGWWWIITLFHAPVQTVTPLLNNFPLAVDISDAIRFFFFFFAIRFCKRAEDVLVRRDAVLPNQRTDDTEHGSIRGGPGRAQKYDLGSEEGGFWFLEEWQSSSLSRPYYGLTCLRGWTEAFMTMVQVRLHVEAACSGRKETPPSRACGWEDAWPWLPEPGRLSWLHRHPATRP